MRKYLLKRILFSLFSLIVVIGVVNVLIYNLMDRQSIFQSDPVYNKLSYNEKEMYKYRKFEENGYLTYVNYAASKAYTEATEEQIEDAKIVLYASETINELYSDPLLKKVIEECATGGYQTTFLPKVKNRRGVTISSPYLLFVKEMNVFERVGAMLGNLFRFETIWDVKDETLTNRGIHIEWDKRSNMPALVGNGTQHKYLIYFDDKFPFIHQNILHIQLGKSLKLSKGSDVVEYMKSYIGAPVDREQVFPKDIDTEPPVYNSSKFDFHSVTFRATPEPSSVDLMYFDASDRYTVVSTYNGGTTRIGTSFIIGLIASIIAYALGLPIGVWMAQRKDKLVDKVGNLYIIFIMAVPSLAYIFMFSSIGKSLFNLPDKFAFAPDSILPFILPVVSLALPSIGGLMKWMRRYMIDQQNADYVKFARSQGLSEHEIFSKHISRNALIFIVHGIPGTILGNLVGAIITERVYGVPGVGNMLTDSISKADNAVIVGVTAFYTAITIVSLILGDLLLAKYDPRISLSSERN